MALITCQFYSETLSMSTAMTVILPQQSGSQIGIDGRVGLAQKHKTLYLLHGFSDDHTIWTRHTPIERYVAELGIAVVMPNCHHSFYTDMEQGGRYWTFLTEELPAVARSFFPLSEAREDNFVAGLSMGGYGAFKWALSYPDRFAAAGSFSGALDIVSHTKEFQAYEHLKRAFQLIYGGRNVAGTGDDLLQLLAREAGRDEAKPLLYQSCGTSDFLYEGNLTFRETCRDLGRELTYEEGPGDHNWAYWDEQIRAFLKWLPL
ncbi:alpha/beta hydrolase [Paenibacillus sp. GCM10027627]|uniref:alpha/beta hydrolase n=1 Tax=unclassified Paenibacillus TaxID=185978 RepID=UPI00363204F5